MRKKLNILVLVGALLAVAAGVSYAAIPSSNGTISACKDNKGALKVIDAEAGQTCNTNQQLLTWNQQGPQGPPGPAGPAVGYAHVESDGNVIESGSLNIADANVKKPMGTHGVYCFDELLFTTRHAVVSLGPGVGPGTGPMPPTPLVTMGNSCPLDSDASVLMIDPSTGAPSRDAEFWILFN